MWVLGLRALSIVLAVSERFSGGSVAAVTLPPARSVASRLWFNAPAIQGAGADRTKRPSPGTWRRANARMLCRTCASSEDQHACWSRWVGGFLFLQDGRRAAANARNRSCKNHKRLCGVVPGLEVSLAKLS